MASAAHGRRGAALVLSLVLVMLIAGLGAGLVQLQSSTNKRYAFSIDRRSALYLAEAGLGEAALAVSLGKSGVIASEAQPVAFGGGVYWVDSVDLPDDRMILTCTAQVGTAELVARTMVVPNVNPVAKLGFFGMESVELGYGTVVDGYHSGRGTYTAQLDATIPVPTTGELGLVGSDGDVLLLGEDGDVAFLSEMDESEAGWLSLAERALESEPRAVTDPRVVTGREAAVAEPEVSSGLNPTSIFGVVRPGRAGVVQSDGTAMITDGIRGFDSPPFLPEVTLPELDEKYLGDFTLSMSSTGVGATRQTDVQGILTVQSGAVLTIEGPSVLLCDQLIVEARASLVLDDALGPIQIYVRDGFQLRAGSIVQSLAPDTLARGTTLFVAGDATSRDRLELEATGQFRGLIYAPDDVIRVPQGLRLIGGAVARVLETAEGTHLTLDRRLGIGGDGLPTLPELLAWQLVPLGDSIAREIRVDPLVALRLRGVAPLVPATGAPENEVSLQYLDHSGTPQTYDGPVLGFNPAGAKTIIGARWEDPRDGLPREWATPPGTESTGALRNVREDLAAIREVVLVANPATDVSSLTDDQIVLEVSNVTDAVALAGAPPAVDRAVERGDAASDDVDQAEKDRANRAARAANALSIEANEIGTAYLAGINPGGDLDAENLIADAYDEIVDLVADRDRSVDAAIDASGQTGAAVTERADKAERELAKVEVHMVQLREYVAGLEALGY